MSGTQICIGRKPCWRSRLRCALTLSRDDLDWVRAIYLTPFQQLHVTYHDLLAKSNPAGPIRSEAELARAQTMLHPLLDAPSLSAPEQDYL